MPRLSSAHGTLRNSAVAADRVPAEALADRLANVTRLREHHLWEILRTLPSLTAARDDSDFRHLFRVLMEREDLVAASQALIDAARPACRLDRLECVDGYWIARILSDGAVPRAVAIHVDRVAAVMAALVTLDRPAPVKQ
ncbi:hypothetical protein GB928_006380 [Shinella curvata]|uniref:Uncharacterized protein n=1 Tax=Shinella curvata TaxID=1817964 RepID=A0ABT8XAP7_9HYPH|nr:hypothetical protein [Shinella curvata]MCJ8054797.1 hypothetical protein [Shinella curvata]MDO6120808.1 hypothetical protein [Shinella curvata]